MALIFPFPSLPATIWWCSHLEAESILWNAWTVEPICHCGWGPAFHKKSSLSPKHSNSRQQGTNVVCTAWAASAVRPAGLSRFPYGPAFSKAKEEAQMGWGVYWELQVHHWEAFKWTPVWPWPLVNAASPCLSKSDCREVCAVHTVGTQAVVVIRFGGIILHLEHPRITIIAFAGFDHVSLKRWKVQLKFSLLRPLKSQR